MIYSNCVSGGIKNGKISAPWKLHTTWKYKYINENKYLNENKAWKEVTELPVLFTCKWDIKNTYLKELLYQGDP